jgi:primase-polymerase (primpol)-like protein
MRRCHNCFVELSPLVRGDARYCSTRCRVAAHRDARRHHGYRLPAELLEQDRWIRRTINKVPLTIEGVAASSTDPTTWSSFDEAATSTVGAGLGFVLNGDGIVCLDLDHCFVNGKLTRTAADLVARCSNTYIELSPSGEGLHIWGRANLGFRGRKIGDVEVYGDARYLTITGDAFGASRRLAPLGKVISQL